MLDTNDAASPPMLAITIILPCHHAPKQALQLGARVENRRQTDWMHASLLFTSQTLSERGMSTNANKLPSRSRKARPLLEVDWCIVKVVRAMGRPLFSN